MSRLPTSGPALRRRIKLALLLEPAPGAIGFRGRRHGRSFSTPDLVPPTNSGPGSGTTAGTPRSGAASRRRGDLASNQPRRGPSSEPAPTPATDASSLAEAGVPTQANAATLAPRAVRPVDVWSVGGPTVKLDALGEDPRAAVVESGVAPGPADDAATQLLPAIPVPPTARLTALDDWGDIADAVERAMTPPSGSPAVPEDSDD